MALKRNNGTNDIEIGKLYRGNGTTDKQIGKVYKTDGTTDSLIYQSSLDVLNLADSIDITGGFTKVDVNNCATLSKTSTGYKILQDTIESGVLGEYSLHTTNKIDVTDMKTITVTAYISFNWASSDENGPLVTNIKPYWKTGGWGDYVARASNMLKHNQTGNAGTYTFTIDVSNVTGSYYIYFRGRLKPTSKAPRYVEIRSITAI